MKEQIISLREAETNLLAAATYLAENIGSSDGHAEAMKEIVALYLDKGDVDSAAQLADSVKDTFVRDRLLTNVAEKCAALDDDEYALQLADAIEDYGLQGIARERIAVQKAAQNEFEKAFEIAETLPHSSDALAEIAVLQAANDNEIDALKIVSHIEFHASKVNALQSIAAYFQNKGDAEKADELFSKAIDEAAQIEFAEEKIRALISIAAHRIEAARFDKAIEILALARAETETLDSVHRDSFLSLISLDFLRAGSIDLADRTLDLVHDKTQIASTLARFSTEFDAKGERGEALETLEEAYAILKSQRDNEIRDSRSRFNVLAGVAVRFAAFEKAERGIEIALENPNEEERHSALTQIAQICVAQGKDDLARQALNAFEEDSARMFALIALSDTKNKLEKNDEALQFLNEAYALCEIVPQLSLRSTVLNELAARFASFGETEKAREIALENLQIISRILDESHKAIALAHLAGVYENLDFESGEAEKKVLETMLRRAEW